LQELVYGVRNIYYAFTGKITETQIKY